MEEGRAIHYAKFLMCDELEKEIEKIEEVINSGKLSANEEMALSDKLVQCKKDYIYLHRLNEGHDEDCEK